ncbi:class A sortase [Enterococcus faecium]|uniref:class A sortase n=1 Tax=Enterococcus faecium TaxID=1352 RepID=UPI00338E3F43
MNPKLRKVPLYLWIGTFLLLIGLYFQGEQIIKRQENEPISISVVQSEKQVEENIKQIEQQANFESKAIRPVDAEQIARAQLNYEEVIDQWSIGSLYIPTANIKTRILAGMADDNLIVGVGTLTDSQRLGQGNYVVLAHSLVNGGGSLGDLPAAAIDSPIYTTDFSNIYIYKVTNNLIVHETEVAYIEESTKDQKPLLTLFRCEGDWNTDKRYLVQAELENVLSSNEVETTILENLGLVKEIDQETINSSYVLETMRDSSVNPAKSNIPNEAFQSSMTKYSIWERFCIQVFLFLNQKTWLVFSGYLLGFLIFLWISR